jgi:hypothetical protein
MFGSHEGPWNHSFRLEHKLGPRLKVQALIDPNVERARAVLADKCQSFVVSAYKNTKVYKTIDDYYAEGHPAPRYVVAAFDLRVSLTSGRSSSAARRPTAAAPQREATSSLP